jgi:hypothetical protein
MADKHLYEFAEGGFYAAASRDDAFRIYDAECGEEGLATDDFKRDVPDDELIEVSGESADDTFDDPREYQRALTHNGVPDLKHVHWHLKVTAREWANELTHGEGHVFGGNY